MNILFTTSDQQRADCYGFEGRRMKTPRLGMLARHATRFAACITPNLVCQPTRASILTGQLPGTHGVSDNSIDLPDATGEAGFGAAAAQRELMDMIASRPNDKVEPLTQVGMA